MITLSELSDVLEEIIPLCIHTHIQKIQQPSADTLILFLRRPGLSLSLLISVHVQYARIHLLTGKIPNAPEPPSFCQYARAHLLRGRIRRIRQVPNDRIIWFEIEKDGHYYFLVAALIGRSANLYVLDPNSVVLRSLKTDRHTIGEPFQITASPLQGDILQDQQEPLPALLSWPVSVSIEEQYLGQTQQAMEDQAHQQALSETRKQIKKQQRRILGLKQDLEKVERYKEYGRYGELLKNHITGLGKGQREITVIDYFDDNLSPITLPLDNEKGGQANLEDYFKKHRKYAGAERNLKPRLAEADHQLQVLQLQLHNLEAEKGDSRKIAQPSGSHIQPHTMNVERTKPRQKPATPYRRFLSGDGLSILVGKSAKDNDALTFRISKPDDLWLHARGTPGSHVVIELEKGQSVPPETLKDAATLALFYSDLRKSGRGEVVHTLRKHVRKAKGQKPGSVIVSQDKTLWVYVDQDRLVRLKDSTASQT